MLSSFRRHRFEVGQAPKVADIAVLLAGAAAGAFPLGRFSFR